VELRVGAGGADGYAVVTPVGQVDLSNVGYLREVFNALRWFVRAGCPWRMLPNDVAPWWAVQQQTQRWIQAGCLEAMAHDLRLLLRVALARKNLTPTVGLLDRRTLPSPPESGARAGYDGAKQGKGPTVPSPVGSLGPLSPP